MNFEFFMFFEQKKMITGRFKPIVPIRDTDAKKFNITDEEQYWLDMKEHAVFEEPASISSCDFAPVSPIHLASTSGIRLAVFEAQSCEPVAIYSRFKERVYSAKYRPDGALLGVSTHNGELQFFDVHTEAHKRHGPRNAIRIFRAHQCKVNAFDYDASGTRVFSGADDGYIKLFSLASDNSAPIWECAAHGDAIRSVASHPDSEHLVATGAYDHKIRLWDIRNGDVPSPVKQFDHGAPVEHILMFSDGNTLASAGASTVKLWDMNTGQLMASIGNHNKTITCMCLARGETCLLTGGIDRRVNVVQLDTKAFHKFPVLRSFQVEAPVVSLAIHTEERFMALGMGNKLAIYQRKSAKEAKEAEEKAKERKKARDVTGFDEPMVIRGQIRKPDIVQHNREGEVQKLKQEPTIRQWEKVHLGKHDHLLREGSFRELVGVLMRNRNAAPELVVAALQQILIRQRLRQALSDQGKQEVERLFFFLRIHLFNTAYFDTLIEVALEALDIYVGKPLPKQTRKNIKLLEKRIDEELRVQEQLSATYGMLTMALHWEEKNKNRHILMANGDVDGNDNVVGDAKMEE